MDRTSAEWKIWDATNSLVAVWLLSSMTPTIAASVDSLVSTVDIWKSVSKMYSGTDNVMLLAETEDRISELKQGERSVMDYVAELQRLWTDVNYFDPVDLPHPDCVAWVKKWIEKRRVLQCLRGLNPEFEARRATLFHQSTLPGLEEAIAAVVQEEARLKVMGGTTLPPPRPAFAVTESSETRTCYNCGEKGHISRDCHRHLKLIVKEEAVTLEVDPGKGRGRGRSEEYKTNLSMTEEGASSLATIPITELEELRRLKKNVDSKAYDQGTVMTSVDNAANLVHPTSGEEDWRKTWDWSSA